MTAQHDSQLIRATLKTWPFDDEPIKSGVAHGIVWACTPGFVGINGYVAVPAERHVWSKSFTTHPDLTVHDSLYVHGGITFLKHPWVGFDTGHYSDYWTDEYDRHHVIIKHPGLPRINWTPKMVFDETRVLARQVAEISEWSQRRG